MGRKKNKPQKGRCGYCLNIALLRQSSIGHVCAACYPVKVFVTITCWSRYAPAVKAAMEDAGYQTLKRLADEQLAQRERGPIT